MVFQMASRDIGESPNYVCVCVCVFLCTYIKCGFMYYYTYMRFRPQKLYELYGHPSRSATQCLSFRRIAVGEGTTGGKRKRERVSC